MTNHKIKPRRVLKFIRPLHRHAAELPSSTASTTLREFVQLGMTTAKLDRSHALGSPGIWRSSTSWAGYASQLLKPYCGFGRA